MFISLFTGLIIGGISVIFALQNIFPVTVTFMVWELTASLAIIIILAMLIGLMIGLLISIPEAIKNMFAMSKLKNENKKLSDDLESVNKTSQQDAYKNSTDQSNL
jgi:lipopolysaccharide assembly protein A